MSIIIKIAYQRRYIIIIDSLNERLTILLCEEARERKFMRVFRREIKWVIVNVVLRLNGDLDIFNRM